MKLCLGVTDVPYVNGDGAVTTGQVADWLEAKYGILGALVTTKDRDLTSAIEKSIGDTIQDVFNGAPQRPILAAACSEIETMMRKWLSSQEVERAGLPGVPTKAALKGVSSRSKYGFRGLTEAQHAAGVRRGARRPSFIETGLMERNYRAWQEG